MDPHPRTVAVIQARMTSTRLPGKSLLDLGGKPLVQRVVERVRRAASLDEVWVATSDNRFDDLIELAVGKIGAPVFRGSLEDVLDRFRQAARAAGAEIIVRVTADNPLTDPRLIDLGVEAIVREGADYLRLTNMPYWTGAEIFSAAALERAWSSTRDPYHREHVCPYFTAKDAGFKTYFLENPIPGTQRPDIRLTLDTMDDYYIFYRIYHEFGDRDDIPVEEVIAFLESSGLPLGKAPVLGV